VLLLLIGHLALWTLLTGISHRAPDWDNMEELVWASSLEWGYYKHPPLPSWLMVGLIAIFGRPVWLTFFAGQLSVVLSLWFVWRLGCEMTSERRALIAVLLVSPIAYYTVRGVMNNHNTIQLWLVAGAIWMFYRAVRHDSMRAWAALGLFSGLAFLTKYSALVQFAAFFLFLLVSGKWSKARTWQGAALATAVLLVLVAPHLLWLYQQPTGPIGYAAHSLAPVTTRLQHLEVIKDFIMTHVGRLAPMALAMLIVVLWHREKRTAGQADGVRSKTLAAELAADDRFFLLFVGLAPLLLTLAGSLLLKAPLAAHWATTFFMLFGFFSFWLLRMGDEVQLLRKTLLVVVVLQIVMAAGYALARGPLSDMTGRATRATFPGGALSARMQENWRSHVATPLRLVAADTWLGGNIAIHAGRDAKVLIDGDLSKSPWISPAEAASCGILLAIDRSPENEGTLAPPLVEGLMAKAVWRGTVELPWTTKTDGPQVVVDWGIIPPQPTCAGSRP
jgi:4-amino-4-deoxy-L-arabinose transferase-like glycosyltransferase